MSYNSILAQIDNLEKEILSKKSISEKEMSAIESELFKIEDYVCVDSGGELKEKISDKQFDFVISEINRLNKLAYSKY